MAKLCFAVFIMVAIIASIVESKNVPKVSNSKYLDPERDEEENIQLVLQDYEIDAIGANELEEPQSEIQNLDENTAKHVRDPKKTDKTSAIDRKITLSSILLPVLSITGLSNGGLYGAQYYGLTTPSSLGWKVPTLSYPFHSYKLSSKTKNDPR